MRQTVRNGLHQKIIYICGLTIPEEERKSNSVKKRNKMVHEERNIECLYMCGGDEKLRIRLLRATMLRQSQIAAIIK